MFTHNHLLKSVSGKVSFYLYILYLCSLNNTVGPLGDTTFSGVNPAVSVHAPVLAIRVFEKDIVSTIVVTVSDCKNDMAQFFLIDITDGIFFTWINPILVKPELVIISLKSNDYWALIQSLAKVLAVIIWFNSFVAFDDRF